MTTKEITFSVTFQKDGKTLTYFEATVDGAEAFDAAVKEVHQKFRAENLDVLLFDGVTTVYDKV